MYVNVARLAWMMGTTSTKANRQLEDAGLQRKRKEDHWTKWRWALTEEGKLYGKMTKEPFPKIMWCVPDTVLRLRPIRTEDIDDVSAV